MNEAQSDLNPNRAPIEFRSAVITDVNIGQRIVEVVAAPYNEETVVEYRGALWRESIEPGAFDGIEKRPNRVRVNREHDESKTFGKVVNFWPSREEGLVAEVRVANTLLGDEVLELVKEDMLGASGALAVRPRDQRLERPFRRIQKAFLRHLSFVEVPAYDSATVLSVRGKDSLPNAADLPPLDTPNLDDVVAWMQTRQVS